MVTFSDVLAVVALAASLLALLFAVAERKRLTTARDVSDTDSQCANPYLSDAPNCGDGSCGD